ncbi:MAG: hypothetical protein ACYSUK_06020 [Planctomycetota bacterium]|jgi:hypothetical protein
MSKKTILMISIIILLMSSYNSIAQQGSGLSGDKPSLPKDETEKKILDVLDDINKNQRRGMMNVPPEDGRVLRMLTEATVLRYLVLSGTEKNRRKTYHT